MLLICNLLATVKWKSKLVIYTELCRNHDESLKEFVSRLKKEQVSIPNCDTKTAIEAFWRGLDEESDLYKELTKYPYPTFEDAQAKALAQIEEGIQKR